MSQLKVCLPRDRQLKYKYQFEFKADVEWVRSNSVFASYQADTQGLIDKLYESDWEMIITPKFKDGDELKQVKAELKKWYWIIRDAFKYYAALGSSTNSSVFALGLNSYTEYLKSSGIFKQKLVTINDTDTLFYAINKREKGTILNPGNSVIRYQFLEVMLRIGLKYTKQKNPVE